MIELSKLKEVYFIVAMAGHILALRLFVPEYTEYSVAFSVALSLPVIYTIQAYARDLYEFKGKYFVVKKALVERIINEISLFIMSTAVGYALYLSFGGYDPFWFLIGFSTAWIMRISIFRIVEGLYHAGIPVEEPPLVLSIGIALGVLFGTLMGMLLVVFGIA